MEETNGWPHEQRIAPTSRPYRINLTSMRTPLLSLLLACFTSVSAQTYFYIDAIQVQPTVPNTTDPVSLDLIGGLSSTGAYVVSASADVLGQVVTINIQAADPGGFTVIVSHTETVELGLLPAGTYTIEFNAVNVGDFAPDPQHTFTVEGGSSVCDSLMIDHVQWRAFDGPAIVVHALNTNTQELFDYPNFILLDANGDTIAIEAVELFGIAADSYHTLALVDGVAPPIGPFLGTLQLWTGFTTELACEWTATFDLCPPAPCAPVFATLNNLGNALAIGTFQWTIYDDEQNIAASGQFELTDTVQYDEVGTCLPPGEYTMVTTPDQEPTGGQVYYGVLANGFYSGPNQALVQPPLPPMPFTFYQECIEGGNSIPEAAPSMFTAQCIDDRLHIQRLDGGSIGAVQVFDVQGRILIQGSSTGSMLTLPVPDATGVLLLRTEHGALRVMGLR